MSKRKHFSRPAGREIKPGANDQSGRLAIAIIDAGSQGSVASIIRQIHTSLSNTRSPRRESVLAFRTCPVNLQAGIETLLNIRMFSTANP